MKKMVNLQNEGMFNCCSIFVKFVPPTFICQRLNIFFTIKDGTTHLLWAVGKGPIFGVDGLDLVDSESTIDHGKA